jgi:hypothetical protein
MNDQERELILKDYEKTMNFIDKIDGYLFQIRNWAIVASSGVIAYAVSVKSSWILIANFFIITGFMFIELFQKSFHEDAMRKSYNIEKIIGKCILGSEPLPMNYRFGLGHSIQPVSAKGILRIIFNKNRWHNLALYFFLALATLGARALIIVI